MLDRRQFLAASAAATFAARTAWPAEAGLDLGADAAANNIIFGSAYDDEVFSDPAYAALLTQQCRAGALENGVKFGEIRPHGPEADYTNADRLVAFGVQRNFWLRGPALIWNDWTPDWLSSLSTDALGAVMDRHIDETVGRYAGRIKSWDVVNEPFLPVQRRDDGLREGVWLSGLGPGYIERAFRRAAAADPSAQLLLNEAFCEQNDELGNSVRPRLHDLVAYLKDKGVKLDAVGFESHLKPHLPHDDAAFGDYVSSIAELGVDIVITELDVDDTHLPDDPAARDAAVAERVGNYLKAMLAVPRLKAVVCWHLSDRYSWYMKTEEYGVEIKKSGGDPTRLARSHLFDRDLKPKAAAFAAGRALARRTSG